MVAMQESRSGRWDSVPVAKPTCSVEDCDRQVLAREMCRLHYDRWGLSRGAICGRPRNPPCAISGCERPQYKSSPYCPLHDRRVLQNGDPLIDGRCKPLTSPPPNLAHLTSPTELARALGVSRQRAHQILNRHAHRANKLLNQAVKHGQIKKPYDCARCQIETGDLEAHHWDYREPLDVRWLCLACHNIVHPHSPGSRSKVHA